MRVLHVIDSLAGSGGAENRLVDEVIALGDRCDQALVRLYERDFLRPRLTEAGIEVIPLGFKAGRAARTWPLAAWRLRGVIKRWKPDVVHTSLFNGNLIGQLAAGFAGGVPVVSTFNHTGEKHLQQELRTGAASRKAQLMQAVGRWAERRGDVHYRAVGSYARETNCDWRGLPLDRATVVHRGVTVTAEDQVADRAAFGLPEGVPVFANVARRVPEKAQHLLVAAFAKVRAELPDAVLAIAGSSGSADAAVEAALEAAGLEAGEDRGPVRLLGFRSDARTLLASADVFAFSSLSEGSPGVVVEALAVGAPVAAFAIPPVAELTDGNTHGWLAEVGSVEGLADAMLAAYRAPDRAARVAAAQAWAERFQLPAIAAELGDLLEARAR